MNAKGLTDCAEKHPAKQTKRTAVGQAASLPLQTGCLPYGYPKVRTMPSRSFFQCDRNLWAALPGA
jgi:hypothetical protein